MVVSLLIKIQLQSLDQAFKNNYILCTYVHLVLYLTSYLCLPIIQQIATCQLSIYINGLCVMISE